MKTKLNSVTARPARAGVNFKHDCFAPGRSRRFAWLIPIIRLAAAVLACTRLSSTASAQSLTWTDSDVTNMWINYVSDFYHKDGASFYVFVPTKGGNTITPFWEEAEEIEMAEDGHEWAVSERSSISNDIAGKINAICIGFTNHNGVYWFADHFDDDKNWAEIAFARAYQITGNS